MLDMAANPGGQKNRVVVEAGRGLGFLARRWGRQVHESRT